MLRQRPDQEILIDLPQICLQGQTLSASDVTFRPSEIGLFQPDYLALLDKTHDVLLVFWGEVVHFLLIITRLEIIKLFAYFFELIGHLRNLDPSRYLKFT